MTVLRLLLAGRWKRGLASSLAVVALIGAIGGFVLASASAARRVENSYRSLIGEIDAPDLAVRTACVGAQLPFFCITESEPVTTDTALAELRALAVVEKARAFDGVLPFLVDASGYPLLATFEDPLGCRQDEQFVEMAALAPGGPAEQALPFRLEGELPAPGSAGVVLARGTAELAGLSIGDTLHLAGYCDEAGDPHRLGRVIDLQITGLSIGPLDVEPPGSGRTVEPAYVDQAVFAALVSRGAKPGGELTVWLQPTATAASVAEELAQFEIVIDLNERATALDEALATDARLLWLLAAVGVVGGLLVLAPAVGRNIRETGSEPVTLSAFGATRRQIALEASAHGGTLGLLGALSAAGLAVVFSAIMPRGLAAAIVPDRQLSIDWLVTVIGVTSISLVMFVIGCIPAWRISAVSYASRARTSQRFDGSLRWPRLTPAAQTGVQAAVGTPAGPRRASPWTSILPMMLVATGGVASLTYLAGLRHLEQTPSLLGWNWNAHLGFDETNPAQVQLRMEQIREIDGVEQVTATLAFPPFFPAAPDAGVSFIWPWVFAAGPDSITPTMLTGRAPDGADEVAIDPVLAEQANLRVGDSVSIVRQTLASQFREDLLFAAQKLGLESPTFAAIEDEPTTLSFEVTGVAVFALPRSERFAQAAFTLDGFAGFAPDADEVAAVRAWLPTDLAPEFQQRVEEILSNINAVTSGAFVRYSGDESSTLSAMARVEGVGELTAPTPEEIWQSVGLNLDRTDRIPVSLAITVAGLFVALVGFLLFAAVRARRFEFAVMRALGMLTGGIRRSVVAQATTTAVVSLIVAIPCGVLVGRWAWLAYARGLDVLPVQVTPWAVIAIVGVATIAVANIAGLLLGWSATRRSPAPDLRSE